MNRPLDDLISIARSVRIEEEAARRGIRLKGRTDRAGPCPRCGGRDRFSINLKKQVFNCRGCQRGGDVIELVHFLDDLDFRQAVALLVGDDVEPRRHYLPPPPPPPPPPSTQPDNRAVALLPLDGSGRSARDTGRNLSQKALPRAAGRSGPRRDPVSCPLARLGKSDSPAWSALSAISSPMSRKRFTGRRSRQTALRSRATDKTFRLSFGPVAGGAIKIDHGRRHNAKSLRWRRRRDVPRRPRPWHQAGLGAWKCRRDRSAAGACWRRYPNRSPRTLPIQ